MNSLRLSDLKGALSLPRTVWTCLKGDRKRGLSLLLSSLCFVGVVSPAIAQVPAETPAPQPVSPPPQFPPARQVPRVQPIRRTPVRPLPFLRPTAQSPRAAEAQGLIDRASQLSDTDEAISLLRQAFDIYQEMGQADSALYTLNVIVSRYASICETEETVTVLQQGLELAQTVSPEAEVRWLTLLSYFYKQRSQLDDAVEAQSQAVVVARENELTTNLVSLLADLGELLEIEDPQAAIDAYNQSLAAAEQASSEASLGFSIVLSPRNRSSKALLGLIRIYESLGETQQAAAFTQTLIDSYQREAQRWQAANLLSTTQSRRLQSESALSLATSLAILQEALALSRSSNDEIGEAKALYELAALYMEVEQYQQALEHGQQGLEIVQGLDLSNGSGYSHNLDISLLRVIAASHAALGNAEAYEEIAPRTAALIKERQPYAYADFVVEMIDNFTALGNVQRANAIAAGYRQAAGTYELPYARLPQLRLPARPALLPAVASCGPRLLQNPNEAPTL